MEHVLKTLIVDDEPIARRSLRERLKGMPSVAVIGEAWSGQQALQQMAELRPDLVFLDLQMPGMGGFEVVRKLDGGHLPVVVLVTNVDQQAIEACDAGAIDFLLKPVGDARLQHAVNRALRLRKHPRDVANELAKIASAAGPPNSLIGRRIVGRAVGEYFLLDPAEILAVQVEGVLVWIVTAKQRFIATQKLRDIADCLNRAPFQRVHRNAIVNVNHIRKISALSNQRWLITLSNAAQLVASKREAHSIRAILRW